MAFGCNGNKRPSFELNVNEWLMGDGEGMGNCRQRHRHRHHVWDQHKTQNERTTEDERKGEQRNVLHL